MSASTRWGLKVEAQIRRNNRLALFYIIASAVVLAATIVQIIVFLLRRGVFE